MTEPKRAEPSNELLMELRLLATEERRNPSGNGFIVKICDSAADEIERLAAIERRWILEYAWMPIEGAPRDGTRVELWVNNHKAGYGAWHDGAFRGDSGEKYCNPTHWRREPAGPESKPYQETKGER